MILVSPHAFNLALALSLVLLSTTASAVSFSYRVPAKGLVTGATSGSGGSGSSGPGACTPWALPAPLGTGGPIVDIKANLGTITMLKQDGSVWMTGSYTGGQFGICTTGTTTTWTRVASGVASIGGGPINETYLLKADGTAWMAGTVANGMDGLGTPSPRDGTRFTQIGTNVKQVGGGGGGGGGGTVLLKNDGTLWYTGSNIQGEAGQGPSSASFYYNFVQVDSNVAWFKKVYRQLYYIKTDGSLWATGSSSYWKLGYDSAAGGYVSTPNMLPLKLGDNVVDVFGSDNFTAYVTADGKVFAAGYDYGQFGKGVNSSQVNFAQIAQSVGNVIGVTGDLNTIKLLNSAGEV